MLDKTQHIVLAPTYCINSSGRVDPSRCWRTQRPKYTALFANAEKTNLTPYYSPQEQNFLDTIYHLTWYIDYEYYYGDWDLFMTTLRQRSSTLCNALIHTIGRFQPHVGEQDEVDRLLRARDERFGVRKNVCFYCSCEPTSMQIDHLIPICSTRHAIFGLDSEINRFPCCGPCNWRKSGKKLEEWLRILNARYADRWSNDTCADLLTWCRTHRAMLYQDEATVNYILRNMGALKRVCQLLHSAAAAGVDVDDVMNLDAVEKTLEEEYFLLHRGYYN